MHFKADLAPILPLLQHHWVSDIENWSSKSVEMLKILGGENIEFLTGGIFTQIQLHFLLRLEIQNWQNDKQ